MNAMNKEQIQTLLDNYFEGLTSLEEEQQLRDYFSEGYVDPDFAIHQPMFQYFKEGRGLSNLGRDAMHCVSTKAPFRGWGQGLGTKRIIRRASIAAAACLLLFVGLRLTVFSTSNHEKSYAYIDGKKYTNVAVVQTQALETLENLAEEDENMLSSQIELLDSLFE